MKKSDPISNVMSTDVVTVTPKEKLSTVKRLMRDLLLHHIPVVDGDKLIGIVSRVDVLQASFSNQVVGSAGASDEWLDTAVELDKLMTKQVVTIKDYDTVHHAAEMLATYDFNALPVVNTDQNLVGIVTSNDLIDYLLRQY